MRDRRYVAEHRGGLLTKAHHRLLMGWAVQCSEHVLPLLGGNIDGRLLHALSVGREWERGGASVGEARKAAVGAIAVANESTNPVAVAVARSVGHAVATAHMADHSPGAALYALKAVKSAGQSVEEEKERQKAIVPAELAGLVLETLAVKGKSMRL